MPFLGIFGSGGRGDDDLSTIYPDSVDTEDTDMNHLTSPSIASLSTERVDHRSSGNRRCVEEERLREMYTAQMPVGLLDGKDKLRSRDGAHVNDGNERQEEEDDNSSSSGSEVSIPPPPPPLPQTRTIVALLYNKARKMITGRSRPPESPRKSEVTSDSSDQDIREQPTTKQGNSLVRNAWIIENHESFESLDVSMWPSSYWDRTNISVENQLPTRGWLHRRSATVRSHKGRICLLAAAIVLLCLIIGISVGVSNNKEEASTSAVAGLRSNIAAPTAAPTSGTVIDDGEDNEDNDEIITVTESPAPVSSCEDMVMADRLCYNFGEIESGSLFIGFVRCQPHPENWVGIYEAGLDRENLPDPLLWLWTCNSQSLADCNDEGTVSDVLRFEESLEPGSYQAHFVDRDGFAPFVASTVSTTFEVKQDCSA